MPLSEFIAEIAERVAAAEAPAREQRRINLDDIVITSPDVMIAAADSTSLRDGDCEWILSECHSGLGLASFPVRVMHERTAWLATIASFLCDSLSDVVPVVVTGVPGNKRPTWGRCLTSCILSPGHPPHPAHSS